LEFHNNIKLLEGGNMTTLQKYFFGIGVCLFFISTQVVFAGELDDIAGSLQKIGSTSLDEKTIISGLKEALSVGTTKAVKLVSVENGYLRNEAIKILLPEKIQVMAEVLQKTGHGKEIDAFILSMNRAAEKAAPKAKPIFVNAVKKMTFQNVKTILNGGNTAATDYFRNKTSTDLAAAFRPAISASVNKVGVTRSYKAMTDRYLSLLPLSAVESLDLDHYVTTKALNGLFYMLAQEETKIRSNPKERTTEILKKVFSK
jgi:hypothetical protein